MRVLCFAAFIAFTASCSPGNAPQSGDISTKPETETQEGSVPVDVGLGQSGRRGIGTCAFDRVALLYPGTDAQQAACLLRKVKARGSGAVVQPLPAWLVQNVGHSVPFSRGQLDSYIQRQGISASELPGPDAGAARVRYFVIHDTGSPVRTVAQGFPSNMDQSNSPVNDLTVWGDGIGRRVNMIVGRDGRSRVFLPWGAARSLPATKLEMNSVVAAARPVFVHVENIQPRLQPPGSWAWMAPTPGFSSVQEERLALAYISASLASGRWLIPAYHFNIDEGLPDGHDDPQNFDLGSWVGQIARLEREITR